VIDDWRRATSGVDNSARADTCWTPIHIGDPDTRQTSLPDVDRPALLFPTLDARTVLAMIKSAGR
jgi:hypothetical protein